MVNLRCIRQEAGGHSCQLVLYAPATLLLVLFLSVSSLRPEALKGPDSLSPWGSRSINQAWLHKLHNMSKAFMFDYNNIPEQTGLDKILLTYVDGSEAQASCVDILSYLMEKRCRRWFSIIKLFYGMCPQ